jgi:hypothetical protein
LTDQAFLIVIGNLFARSRVKQIPEFRGIRIKPSHPSYSPKENGAEGVELNQVRKHRSDITFISSADSSLMT